MKLLLEIKGLFDSGRGYQIVKHEVEVKPKFKLKRNKIDSMKIPPFVKEALKEEYGEYVVTSRKEQYDDYLAEDSNNIIRNIMDDLGIHAIENWKILRVGEARKVSKKKTKKTKIDKNKSKVRELMIELRDRGEISHDLMNEFEAFYTQMYHVVKHLSPEDQIKIVMSSVDTGMKSAIEAYKHIREYSESLKDLSLQELKELEENKKNKELKQ